LAVGLALGGAGADGGPADQIGNVLGRDGVQQFGSGGHAQFDDLAQKTACDPEPLRYVARAVQIRIHDEALPADRGAGFLKINAHDEEHAVADLTRKLRELFCILASRLEVVDGAGADHDKEARVVSKNDPVDGLAAPGDELFVGIGAVDFRAQLYRGG